jgi:hypothetical protein
LLALPRSYGLTFEEDAFWSTADRYSGRLTGAGAIGYELGYSHALSASQTSIEKLNNQIDSSLVPASSDPFSYTFVFKGNFSTAYVPIIFLAPNTASQVYARYSCPEECQVQSKLQNFSINSLNITSVLPMIFTIGQDGSERNATAVGFTSATVLQSNGTSETVLYALSATANDVGYYSFLFPNNCLLHPLLYIGTQARNLDYSLVSNWLEKSGTTSQACTLGNLLDVNLLGFTNTYYNRLGVGFNST